MKKIIIFFIMIIVIVAIISMIYLNYKVSYNEAKKENSEFEYYYQKDVYGSDIATIINKAVDNNLRYEVQRDNNYKFIDNNESSIKIDINIIDTDTTYDMETLYAGGMDKFVQYYSTIQFKCTKIEYHKNTGKVKFLLFEQITQ